MQLQKSARVIIFKAMKREQSRYKVAKMYGIAPEIVDSYQRGEDCGTLHAREVIRVEIARYHAERNGVQNFVPTNEDRYKGNRRIR